MKPRRRIRSLRRGAVSIVGVATIACGPTVPAPYDGPPLAELGTARGVLVGAAVTSNSLRDPAYAAAVTTNFNSITAEYEMKWRAMRPTASTWDWAGADAIVAFGTAHHLAVRGHTLVWGRQSSNPDWLTQLTDPVAFRAATLDGITAEVSRYAGRVDRWDVVNEPFSSSAPEPAQNMFSQRIGADYVDQAFHAAHAADPGASLWVNEVGLEYSTARADAFVTWVQGLLARGVPIDGVGLESHVLSLSPPAAGALQSVIGRLRALGLRTAITELDVPSGPARPADQQRDIYGRIATECLAAGCSEITTWGVSDAASWLDAPSTRAEMPSMSNYPVPCNPLLLDAGHHPKSAYAAVAAALAETALSGP